MRKDGQANMTNLTVAFPILRTRLLPKTQC